MKTHEQRLLDLEEQVKKLIEHVQPSPWMTIAEFAAYYKTSTDTVRDWINRAIKSGAAKKKTHFLNLATGTKPNWRLHKENFIDLLDGDFGRNRRKSAGGNQSL